MNNTGLFDAQQGSYGNVPGANVAYGLGQFGFVPFGGQQMGYNSERQNSLSQEQQMELMNALETEGMGEIDAFLNMGTGNGGNANGWS